MPHTRHTHALHASLPMSSCQVQADAARRAAAVFRSAVFSCGASFQRAQPDMLSWPCKLYESKAHGPSVIVFNLGKQEPAASGSCPPPPPRLHYSTFWRSVARRVYHEGMEKLKKETRDSCMQQSTTNRVFEDGDALSK